MELWLLQLRSALDFWIASPLCWKKTGFLSAALREVQIIQVCGSYHLVTFWDLLFYIGSGALSFLQNFTGCGAQLPGGRFSSGNL